MGRYLGASGSDGAILRVARAVRRCCTTTTILAGALISEGAAQCRAGCRSPR